MSKELIHDTTSDLSAQEIHFSKLVASGYGLSSAYKKAFPAKSHLKVNTIWKNASELASQSKIALEVATTKQRQAQLARLAEDRIDEQLTSGKMGKVTSDVAMFMYNHANGLPTQKVQHAGIFVHASYDLTGKNEAVPDEILQQLKED